MQTISNGLTIIQGDVRTELQHLDAASVDLIIADPPYNVGKDFGNNLDQRSIQAYREFTQSWLTPCHRLLKPTGSLYVFMGVRFISYLYTLLEETYHYHFNSWICWFYTQGLGKRKGYSPRHDDILYFNRSSDFTFNLDAVRIPQKYYRARNNMRGANPGDVWEFSHIHYCHPNRQNHPTQKPEGLIERMIRASSNEGDVVLDPFLGSGTTARVCQQLNRSCIGVELNPAYIEMTKKRLEQPFEGFDSVDPRMLRIPKDLRDPVIKATYLKQHESWFLPHTPHPKPWHFWEEE
jgi:DNA modification methylase